jgi:pyrimidine precursor biosynthesis enzyme
MTTQKISFLLNWEATPYHTPLFLAQSLGYFKDEGVQVAILEPNDPSDVTEMIGSTKIDMGAKGKPAVPQFFSRTSLRYPELTSDSKLQPWYTPLQVQQEDFRSLV